MQTDSRVTGLRARIGVGHEDDFFSKQCAQEIDGRRMPDEFSNGTPYELNLRPYLLVHTVIHCLGFQPERLFLETCDVVNGKKIREDEVTLYFDLANALS